MNKIVSAVIYLIIGLAVIGIAAQLLTNTMGFLKSLFIMIGIGVVIFGVLYFILSKNRTSDDEMKKYKQAAKQSKLKYDRGPSKTGSPASKKQMTTKSKRRLKKRPTHLRVIEGNKSKKKRASN